MYWIFIILILFFVYLKFYRNQTIEGFYTLFFPFYDPRPGEKFAHFQDHPKNALAKSFSFNFLLSHDLHKSSNIRLFFKSFIAYQPNVYYINFITKYNHRENLEQLKQNKADFAVIPAPIVDDVYQNSNLDNVTYGTTFHEHYVFVIVSNLYKIEKVTDLKDAAVSMGPKGSLWERVAKDISHNLKLNWRECCGTLDKMIEDVHNHTTHAMVLTDQYPSHILNYIIYNHYDLKILPLYPIKNFDHYYEVAYIDMAKMPALYIPKVIDNVKYTFFNTQMMTYKFPMYLLVNKKVNEDLVCDLITHAYNNDKMLQKAVNSFTFLPIPIHPGARKFYLQYGYISEDGTDAHCRFTYGYSKCGPRSLHNQRLDYDKYYTLQ